MSDNQSQETLRVGVVVVNYNTSRHVGALLSSLALDAHPLPVLIWDNGSQKAELDLLEDVASRYPTLSVVRSPVNLGFGAAVNRGLEEMVAAWEPDYVWVVNPDVVAGPDTLRTLLRAAVMGPFDLISPYILTGSHGSVDRTWYCGGELDVRAGRSVHWDIGKPIQGGMTGSREVTFVTGAAPLVRVDTWRRAGGFREDLFLYFEDAELSMRWREQGYRLGVCYDSVAIHWEGAASGGSQSVSYFYYMARNRLLVFGERVSKGNLILGWGALETIRLLLIPLRTPTGSLERVRATLAGIWDGLRDRHGPRVVKRKPKILGA